MSDLTGNFYVDVYSHIQEAARNKENLSLFGTLYVPESTCRIERWYAHTSRDEIGNSRVGLSCGHLARQLDNYCSRCGARIERG